MPHETNGSGITRSREPASPEAARQSHSHSGWLKPFAVALPVLVSAAALAPRWATRTYPLDAKLVGSPSIEKIKAPYDFEVVDQETTDRLRAESVALARRVFDFDVELGTTQSAKVEAAFDAALEVKAGFVEVNPLYRDPTRLTRYTRGKLEDELRLLLEEVEPQALLGVELSAPEIALLRERLFDEHMGQVLAEVVEGALSQPVVNDLQILEEDVGRGLTVQKLPDDGTADLVVNEVDSIADVERARANLTHSLGQLLPDLPEQERAILGGIAAKLVQGNLTLSLRGTQIAREMARLGVKSVKVPYKQGEVIVRDGERVTARHLLIFEELSRGSAGKSTLLVATGGGVLVLLLLFAGFGPGRRWVNLQERDLLFLATLYTLVVSLARLWLMFTADVQDVFSKAPPEAFVFILPIAAGAMITRMVLRVEAALLFAIITSVTVGLMVETQVSFIIYSMVGSVIGTSAIRTMFQRSALFRAGLWVGLGQAGVAVALQAFDANTAVTGYVVVASVAFVSGILAAIVSLAMTLVVEAVFGYTTDLKLLELANLNHPALKAMIVQAPGSYHHSVIVGSLVEAAAEEIGANALLTRVMAYYHDIGKGENPAYFIENQRGGHNPHNKLKPSMSAIIIRRHVTDGLELARKYRLGEQIMAGIAEHHGTTLIQFFFQKAKEAEDESNPVSEQDYRYGGHKPRSREAALVMLGDAIEAASRSLAEPTPARLQGLVQRIINLKFSDGQLEECDLTLADLHSIAKSFTRVLKSIYHGRPEYAGVVNDMTGKKPNGDLDSKPQKQTEDRNSESKEDRPDNLRRLGLD